MKVVSAGRLAGFGPMRCVNKSRTVAWRVTHESGSWNHGRYFTRIIPSQLALVDQHACEGRGHRFRRRADREDGVLINGCGFPDFADAVPSAQDHAVVFDGRDGDTWDMPLAHGVL